MKRLHLAVGKVVDHFLLAMATHNTTRNSNFINATGPKSCRQNYHAELRFRNATYL